MTERGLDNRFKIHGEEGQTWSEGWSADGTAFVQRDVSAGDVP
jgi:hypothetical protein